MCQTKEKCDFLVLSRSDFWMVWRCHGKVAFWKLIGQSYVQSSSSTTTRYTDSSILKDSRTELNISRTWINICANSFVKTLLNIMKQKSIKVPGKISAAQKSEPTLPGKLHQNRSHFTCFISFFFSQIKLVIKSKVAVTSNSLVKGSSFRESSFVLTQANYRKLQSIVKRK